MTQIYPEFFRRIDESLDQHFYTQPRFVTHIDKGASRFACSLYDRLLPAGTRILDLMSGYYSHLPEKFRKVTGLGLNARELAANENLSDYVVYDLNRNERLPFNDRQFDGAVCTASVQYMTRPTETFSEVGRSLAPGAPFIVTFSNRMFPTKAILAWRSSDDAAHIRLVETYFKRTGYFCNIQTSHFVPPEGDPLYAVWGYRN